MNLGWGTLFNLYRSRAGWLVVTVQASWPGPPPQVLCRARAELRRRRRRSLTPPSDLGFRGSSPPIPPCPPSRLSYNQCSARRDTIMTTKRPPCREEECLSLGVGSWTDFYLFFSCLSLHRVQKRPQFLVCATHSLQLAFQEAENI